jgi:selenoprotein W-related protein
LLEKLEHRIEAVTLVPSDGGRFEVTVNGELVHSKSATGDHPDQDSLVAAIAERF